VRKLGEGDVQRVRADGGSWLNSTPLAGSTELIQMPLRVCRLGLDRGIPWVHPAMTWSAA
jgi:hypothetical protein